MQQREKAKAEGRGKRARVETLGKGAEAEVAGVEAQRDRQTEWQAETAVRELCVVWTKRRQQLK